MKNLNISKKNKNWLFAFTIVIFLLAGGCYIIKYVIQPTVVGPNSKFDVKIGVYSDTEMLPEDNPMGYGILGILLPEGWSVNDSAQYFKETRYGTDEGFFCYKDGVVTFLKSKKAPPEGYYWWGAQSLNLIYMTYFDSGYINVIIKTDEKIGDFKVQYVLGDDYDLNKQSATDLYTIMTESKQIPVKVDITQDAKYTSKDKEMVVYPNPASNQISFNWNQDYNQLNLKLYQVNGVCVLEKEISSKENINIEKLPKGTYVYKVFDKNQMLHTGKLVVR